MGLNKDMTNEMCQCLCLDEGKAYAGTQFFTQCYCGDNLPANDMKLPEADCASTCGGNSSQICGDGLKNGIYGTGLENRK